MCKQTSNETLDENFQFAEILLKLPEALIWSGAILDSFYFEHMAFDE